MRFSIHKVIPVLLPVLLIGIPFVVHAQAEQYLQGALWGAVTGIFGTILGLCGWLLDVSINSFVIGFADEYNTSGMGVAIDEGWALVRDIMNLLFIFGLLYIGFKIILNSDDSRTRSLLARLIIAALLVNFSLFISKFVVDTSNAFASQIAISGFYGNVEAIPGDPNGATRYKVQLSEDLMTRMGLGTVFDHDNNGGPTNDWGYIFGTAILFIVTSFVFISGAIMLFIRFVALNFFILFSPIMFVGWAFPPLAKFTPQYWKMFLGRAFFAPVYFLLIYFSLSIIGALEKNRGLGGFYEKNFAGELQNAGTGSLVQSDTSSAFPYFVVATASMLFALFAAQKLGADGASTAISMGRSGLNKAQRTVKNGSIRSGKFVASQTVGRGARFATERTGAGLKSATRNLQELKGDSIAARGIRKIARTNAVERYGYDAGEKMTKAKYGLSYTRDEDKKQRYQTEERANLNREIKLGLEGQKWLDEADENNGFIYTENFSGEKTPEKVSDMTEERKKELHIDLAEKLPENVAKMSKQDFEALPSNLQTQVAPFASASLSEAISKSDDLSQEQKDEIKKSQQEAIQKSIEGVLNEQRVLFTDKLANLSVKQIETMGADFIKQNAHLFTDSQFSDIKKSNRFSEKQVGDFIGARKSKLTQIIESGDKAMIDGIFRLTEKELDASGNAYKSKARKAVDIAKMPGKVLAHPNAVPYLNADVLKAITNNDRENSNVSTDDRQQLKINVEVAAGKSTNDDDKKRLEQMRDYLKSPKAKRDFV